MTLSMMLQTTSSSTNSTSNCGIMGQVVAEEDPPKRPPSAYNIFFQVERQRLITHPDNDDGMKDISNLPYSRAEVYSICLDKATRIEKSKRPHRKQHGVISFTDLAKTIATKWKALDAAQKQLFEERADDEKAKYAAELEEWLLCQTPTQQVRKRLSALRRGPLSKFLLARSETVKSNQMIMSSPSLLELHAHNMVPNPAITGNNNSNNNTLVRRESMVHSVSQDSSPSPSVAEGVTSVPTYAVTPPTPPRTLVDLNNSNSSSIALSRFAQMSPERRRIQLQRARNLERLYQMQMQLYNEQIKLHAECNGLYEPPSQGIMEDEEDEEDKAEDQEERNLPSSERDSPTHFMFGAYSPPIFFDPGDATPPPPPPPSQQFSHHPDFPRYQPQHQGAPSFIWGEAPSFAPLPSYGGEDPINTAVPPGRRMISTDRGYSTFPCFAASPFASSSPSLGRQQQQLLQLHNSFETEDIFA